MAAVTVVGWGMGVGTAPSLRGRRASVYRRRRLAALAVVVAAGLALVLGAPSAGRWALSVLGGGTLTASEAASPAAAAASSVSASAASSASSAAVPVVHLRAQPVSQATYVVAEGDTLWSIARRLQPTGDIRPLVDALSTARHGRPLQVGEPIVMPHLRSP